MRGSEAHGAWLVAGLLPGAWGGPPAVVLAWVAALLAGAFITSVRPVRWVAIGWLAAVLVPGTPLSAVAAGGLLGGDARGRVRAAACGAVIGLAALPPLSLRAGALLFLAGLAMTAGRVLLRPAEGAE